MKTAKKRHTPDGWQTTVTTDDGDELVVELIRGGYKRNWFGNDTYYWKAIVVGPGWRHCFPASQGDSAQWLARHALRTEEKLKL